jgi:hypothetical protein
MIPVFYLALLLLFGSGIVMGDVKPAVSLPPVVSAHGPRGVKPDEETGGYPARFRTGI